MAISATEIFRRHQECFEPATAKLFQEGHDPLSLPGVHFTRQTAESIAINSVPGGAIIMARLRHVRRGPCTAPSPAQYRS